MRLTALMNWCLNNHNPPDYNKKSSHTITKQSHRNTHANEYSYTHTLNAHIFGCVYTTWSSNI